MPQHFQGKFFSVVGPSGTALTLDDLPAPDTKRWVIRRKAEVVAAVRGGLLSLDNGTSNLINFGANGAAAPAEGSLGWKILLPLSIANLLITAIVMVVL